MALAGVFLLPAFQNQNQNQNQNMSLLPSVPGSQGILEGVVYKIQTYMGGAVFTYKTYGLVHTQKRWIFMPT